MSLDILAAHAAARPDDDAVTDGDLVLSLSELNEAVNRYGNVLRGLDVRAGEKVLWVGENSWEVVAVNHAARKVGAVCVPMNYRLAPDEAAYVIDNCDAVVVLFDIEQTDRSEEHTSELQSLMRISYAVFCLKKKTTNVNFINLIVRPYSTHLLT